MNRVRLLAFAAILLTAISAAAPAGAACMDEKFFSSGGSSIAFLTDDDSYFYAATLNGRIIRVNKADKSSQDLAVVAAGIEGLLADSGTLYYVSSRFTDAGSQIRQIYSLPSGGGTAVLLGETTSAVGRMAADAQSLYWIVPSSIDQPNGAIQKIARSGGAAQTLASNLAAPVDLAVDSTWVYYTEAGIAGAPPYGLRKISKNGGSSTILTSDRSARMIAGSDGTYLFFSARENDTQDRIYRIPVAGGSASPFTAPLQAPTRLELIGGRIIYSSARFDWSNGNTGSVGVVEPGGTIITLLDSPARSFTADAAAIYALTGVSGGGSVERVCLNYATAPKIESVSGPGISAGGTLVFINGERFQSGAKVTFDGIEGQVVSVTSTQIQVRTPAHRAGIVTMYVVNPDGQSGRSSFFFVQSNIPKKRAVKRQ